MKRIIITLILLFSLYSTNIFASDINISVTRSTFNNFGGIDKDGFKSIVHAEDGFIACGYSWAKSFGTGNLEDTINRGGMDGIIVKYNDQGEMIYLKNFGGLRDENFYGVTQCSDGIVAVGYSYSSNSGDLTGSISRGGQDGIIVKYDNNGNLVWANLFGGEGSDQFKSVCTVSDGYIAVGEAESSSFRNGDLTDIQPEGLKDCIIAKFDYDGNLIWVKSYGSRLDDSLSSIVPTNTGFAAVGTQTVDEYSAISHTYLQIPDALIVNFDFDGNVLWAKNFGGPEKDYFESVTKVPDGIIAVGQSYYTSFNKRDWAGIAPRGTSSITYDATIVKFDFAGNIIWKKNFGGSDSDNFCGVTSNSNCFIACGNSSAKSFGNGDLTGLTAKGGADSVFVCYDFSGNILWKDNFGGPTFEYAYAVAPSNKGFISVGYAGETTFGFGDWVNYKSKGLDDAFYIKYDIDKLPDITTTVSNAEKLDNAVNITCKFKNCVSNTQDAKAICAIYDSENCLVGIKSIDLILSKSQETDKTFSCIINGECCKAKILVLDDLNSINPMAEVIEENLQ